MPALRKDIQQITSLDSLNLSESELSNLKSIVEGRTAARGYSKHVAFSKLEEYAINQKVFYQKIIDLLTKNPDINQGIIDKYQQFMADKEGEIYSSRHKFNVLILKALKNAADPKFAHEYDTYSISSFTNLKEASYDQLRERVIDALKQHFPRQYEMLINDTLGLNKIPFTKQLESRYISTARKPVKFHTREIERRSNVEVTAKQNVNFYPALYGMLDDQSLSAQIVFRYNHYRSNPSLYPNPEYGKSIDFLYEVLTLARETTPEQQQEWKKDGIISAALDKSMRQQFPARYHTMVAENAKLNQPLRYQFQQMRQPQQLFTEKVIREDKGKQRASWVESISRNTATKYIGR